jgi:hypothetical protein
VTGSKGISQMQPPASDRLLRRGSTTSISCRTPGPTLAPRPYPESANRRRLLRARERLSDQSFIQTGITNAGAEGYNRLVKQVKRVACGFRNRDNSARRIRFHCTRKQRAGGRALTPGSGHGLLVMRLRAA